MYPTKVWWDVVSQPFKRSQNGLFQGKMKQYGNNVPFSKHKTRRSWLPNIHHKRLPSEILGETIRVKLTTRALKTIKKEGGLDNYLKNTSADILGYTGMQMRMRIRGKSLEARGKLDKRFELLTPEQEATQKAPKALTLEDKPSLKTARLARVLAARSLGKEGLASIEETIDFLKAQETVKSSPLTA